jgi:hypothetical protein
MTEQEWMECDDPLSMLSALLGMRRTTDRKLRYFASACSRLHWEDLTQLGRSAVVVGEQFADNETNNLDMYFHRWTLRNMPSLQAHLVLVVLC